MTSKDTRMEKGIRRAFSLIREMVKDPDRYPEDTVILAPDHVGEVFSPERARLYMVVEEQGRIESIGELARLLGRDISRVSRDVSYLEGFDLLRVERAGKAKRVIALGKAIVVI